MTNVTTKLSVAEVLFLSFELGMKEWKLAFGTRPGSPVRMRTIPARDLVALRREIAAARLALGVGKSCQVVSCYEAGRDGFWLHRWLLGAGVANIVVDSASIEVNRRKRRSKTDRLDAKKLLSMLTRHTNGEQDVWSVVNVPSEEDEDSRNEHRSLRTLKKERTRLSNRIKGLLMSQGVRVEKIDAGFLRWLTRVTKWDRKPLLPGLQERAKLEYERLVIIDSQIRTQERAQHAQLRSSKDEEPKSEAESRALQQVKQLSELRGIGEGSGHLLVREFFGWRKFKNRREIGGLLGFAPTPYQSGEDSREQGISKAGNRHVRGTIIQLAWAWLRFQPDSQLTAWFMRRFAGGGPRMRKIGIVAVGRKLVIALWRYLEFGEVPDGAELKQAA